MADLSGGDSFEVVKGFVARFGDRKPGREDVKEIAEALRDIFARLMRVRAVAPTVDLSDRMWELMGLAGIKPAPVRVPFGIRRAAIL